MRLPSYLKLMLSLTTIFQVSLNADSLEDSSEFQRMLAEARKSNQKMSDDRAEERAKEAEAARQAALLKMEKETQGIKFINLAGENIEKQNVDYVELSGLRNYKGHLEFFIAYYSRESGQQVFWRDGTVIIDCKAYLRDGTPIGSIENKNVQSSKHFLYIKTTARQGTLKCNINFYGKHFNETATF